MNAGSGGGYQIIARPGSFAATAAAFLARQIAALAARDSVSIALSGGRTPGPIYELLAGSPLVPWEQVSVYFADERAVPRDDPRSNYRLVQETLLERGSLPDARVHPMIPGTFSGSETPAGENPAFTQKLDRLARAYEETLPPRLDLVVLGLGDDGHTASLFPGSAALDERQRRVLAVVGPSEPRHRLTITSPVIEAARLVVVLVRGPSKTRALRQALQRGPASEVPGRLARSGIWLIGSDALPPDTGSEPPPARAVRR